MGDDAKLYILLVEDSKIAMTAASSILTHVGCLVDMAETGAYALELLDQKKYDLILIDIGLPDTDGIVLIKKIKGNENVRKIPVVALTAHDQNDLVQKCFDAGIVDFLMKPLTLEKVSTILKRHIKINTL